MKKQRLLFASLLFSSCNLLFPIEPPEESSLQCNDEIDNDEDGLLDCQELACQSEPSCAEAPRCGDGIINQPTEQCDLNNLNGFDDCTDLELPAGKLRCDDECRFDTSQCEGVVGVCGDGNIDPGEECDLNNFGGLDCTDFGQPNGFLICDEGSCTINTSQCNPIADCGNDITEPGELCDNLDVGANSCQSFGLGDGELRCQPDCQSFDTAGCENVCPDNDGDGFLSSQCGGDDCNDDIFEIRPNATEDCNGIDNDCDGFIDRSDSPFPGGTLLFPDEDQDNFGAFGQPSFFACELDAGALNNTDCDDFNPTINPGAQEQCDNIDNNCDAQIDLSNFAFPGGLFSFPDGDQDNFGSGSLVFFVCQGVPGFAPNNLDCNDADNTINPNAADVCDFVDTDCNGALEFCSDGNSIGGDGCNSFCNPEVCGDGLANAAEQCDDGAANSDTEPGACRTDCTLPACGDGVVDPGQVCFDDIFTLATPGNADSLVVADFDGINGPDVAASIINNNEVLVLFNNGSGAFTLSADILSLGGPFGLAAADFDGINGVDIAIGSQFEQSFKVSLNNGDQTFAQPFAVATSGNIPSLTAVDLDGANGVDLLIGGNGVNFFPNTNNNAAFVFAGASDTNNIPFSIATGDFDNDGDIDFVSANQINNNGTLFINADGLGLSINATLLPSGDGPSAVTAGDFDGDLDLDLAFSNRFINQVRLFENNGTANFTDVGTLPIFIDGAALQNADLDQDGRLDLVAGAISGSFVSVVLGAPGGFAPSILLPSPGGSRSLAIADIDRDGALDIVVTNHQSATLGILFANP